MRTPQRRLSVEQGRAMLARARVCRALEIAGIVASGIAMPLFAVSYLELRDIDLTVLAGGESRVPYFAWACIALFILGWLLAFSMRRVVRRIADALEAEQRRRWVERDAGDETWGEADAAPAVTGDSGPPAVAG